MTGILLSLLITAGTESPLTMRAVRIGTPPKIDGIIDQIWQEGDSAKHFIQQRPDCGEPASESTTVYLLFDDAHLYVCFKCYADPDRLVRQISPRENAGGDNIGLLLDTYNDRLSGYYFAVNAQGVEYDSRITQDGDNWDDSWDGVWYSAARISTFGYCVELKIPFKAIRYPPGITEWGINFDRSIPRNGEAAHWSAQEPSGWKVSKSGRLTGIQPGSIGVNLEIYPVGLLRYEPSASPGTMRLAPDAGLDIAWSPGSAATIQGTINPDFAQIEADPTQVNLGRYELWYSERRPFFTEGAELFNSDIQIFYSRRIGRGLPDGSRVPILAGLKLTLRSPGLEIGGLTALCGARVHRDGIEPQSNYSAVSFRLTDTMQSGIGVLYAGKENARLSNQALDFLASWRQGDWSFNGELAPAWYNAPRESARAMAGAASLLWRPNNWYGALSYANTPADFNVSQIGYRPQHYDKTSLMVGPRIRNWHWFRLLAFNLGAHRWRDNDNRASADYSYSLGPSVSATFPEQWGITLSASPSWSYNYVCDPPLRDSVFFLQEQSYFGNLWFDRSGSLTGYCGVFYCTRGYNYLRHYFAPNASGWLAIGWRPAPPLQLEAEVNNIVELDSAGGIQQMNWVITPRVNYALTRDLQVRLSGEAVPADWSARVNLLLAYNFSPKSWCYLAWNESRTLGAGWPVRERIGVLKLRYLFYF